MKIENVVSNIILYAIFAFGAALIIASLCMFIGSVVLGLWGWLHG